MPFQGLLMVQSFSKIALLVKSDSFLWCFGRSLSKILRNLLPQLLDKGMMLWCL
jgi:hypothetical protein